MLRESLKAGVVALTAILGISGPAPAIAERRIAMRKLTATIALLLTIWPWPGYAGPQWCTGTVSNVWVAANGDVFLRSSWRGDYSRVCNINELRDGVSPKTCTAWFASLQSAIARRSTVVVFYVDAPECAALPIYEAAPTPYYVMNVD